MNKNTKLMKNITAGNMIVGKATIPAKANIIAMIVVMKLSMARTSKKSNLNDRIKNTKKKPNKTRLPIKNGCPIDVPIPAIKST
ncbi:unnamed protein product, partial [marine sediment metagenome]